MATTKLESGQLWRQTSFPFHSRSVLSVPSDAEGRCFCLLSANIEQAQIACSEEDGTWLYTPHELSEHFCRLGYERVGYVRPIATEINYTAYK